MKKRSIQWDDLRTLAAVHRGGSLSAAARELGLTHATVGRRLRALEEALGSALFERGEDGQRLSETGRLALASANQMEAGASQLERRLQGRPEYASGKVRLTCTEGFGTHLLPAHLPSLQARHPRLELELLIEPRRLSLARRHADLALRLARPEEPELVARHLADLRFGLFCHPERATEMRQLLLRDAPLPLCQLDSSLAHLPESQWLAQHLPQARAVLRSNSVLSLEQACAAGAGVALLACYVGRRHGLVELDAPSPPWRPLWLAYPAEYREVPRFRAVADWLIALFAHERATLAGEA